MNYYVAQKKVSALERGEAAAYILVEFSSNSTTPYAGTYKEAINFIESSPDFNKEYKILVEENNKNSGGGKYYLSNGEWLLLNVNEEDELDNWTGTYEELQQIIGGINSDYKILKEIK